MLARNLSLALVFTLFAACSKETKAPPPSGPRPVLVDLHTVVEEPIEDVVQLVGALTAVESVWVRPETEGVVDSIAFQEGESVRAGEPLVQLRNAEEAARLAEAEAELALARHEFHRAETLAAKRSLSQSELDRARATMEVAAARRDWRKVVLARKQVRAPFHGVLGERLVSPGDSVERSTDLVQIDAIDELRLVFTLPEIAVGLARPGLPLEIEVVPFPGERFPGKIDFVAPTVEPRNRRLLVKARVPNRDHRLRPGLFAKIFATVAEHPKAIVVPETAVAYDPQGAFVWRVGANDQAERVAVELGIRNAGRVEITRGLATGDRIVSAGTHKVMAGSLLRPAAAAAPQA